MSYSDYTPDPAIEVILAGDVMTGRGIDQILAHPGDPHLKECYVRDAREYVALAASRNGSVPFPVDDAYIWGDALAEFERPSVAARIVNLETSITISDDPWPKGINYRMHPDNIGCLTRAKIDCCLLSNNHVLDWGFHGLDETIQVLRKAGIATAGAGRNADDAELPAMLTGNARSRIVVFSGGFSSSGIPARWAARKETPGVNLLRDYSSVTLKNIGDQVRRIRNKGDLVIYSLHWGDNWGYEIAVEQRQFAHGLIDEAAVDVVHGHSSHHPKGIEIYRGKLIIYGAGDLLNDYEGIAGYERFRGDLVLLYRIAFDPHTQELRSVHLVPMKIRRLRLQRTSTSDSFWLAEMLDRESIALNVRVAVTGEGNLSLTW